MENLIDVKHYPICYALKHLLIDKTTKKNIIFATDSYEEINPALTYETQITEGIVKGIDPINIQPRVQKDLSEQAKRTKKRAEVFTPSWMCNQMNNFFDEQWFGKKEVFNKEEDKNWKYKKAKIKFPKGKTWMDYVLNTCLEITCGEAPFIISRYDTSNGNIIPLKNRIGLLDRKIRVINENVNDEKEWIKWVENAYKSVFGYEFQGDNLLIARLNLLITFSEYLSDRWNRLATIDELKKISNIICWNFWQMNGLNGCVPYKTAKISEQLSFDLFLDEEIVEEDIQKCKIYRWSSHNSCEFNLYKGENIMKKFDFVIGNPPYQGENHQQIYPDFYLSGQTIGECVEMIFPVGWQEPKNANNLRKLNSKEIKEDKQIVFIDNRENVFPSVVGAKWTNVVLWKKGYDNKLDGMQRVLTNGANETVRKLNYDKSQIEKPKELIELSRYVKEYGGFESVKKITSVRKPYGLSTDVIKDGGGI